MLQVRQFASCCNLSFSHERFMPQDFTARQRVIEEMRLRKLASKTQDAYIRAVLQFITSVVGGCEEPDVSNGAVGRVWGGAARKRSHGAEGE